jgi:3'-5' exoribonuclease
MTRRYVNELSDNESVQEVFLATEKQIRPNRNGNLYIQVNLSDRTGTVGARLWNATDAMMEAFENNDYVRVEGTTQRFQGAIQMIAKKITRVNPESVDPEEFRRFSKVDTDKLFDRLKEMLRSLKDPQLVNLADCFLMDERFVADFRKAPAGVKVHHAYEGGLLEHVVTVMELAEKVAPFYPDMNPDMLVMGAFLHDVAKIEELSYDQEMAYTDSGQLLGHLVLAVELLDRKIVEAEKLSGEPFDEEMVVQLKHILLSHHGEYTNGSPKLPMTMEAMALYCLDTLDSKLAEFRRHILDDPNAGSPWTNYIPTLERKIYKGKHRC